MPPPVKCRPREATAPRPRRSATADHCISIGIHEIGEQQNRTDFICQMN